MNVRLTNWPEGKACKSTLAMQDWLADGGGWEEGGDNVKYSFFSMTKAVEALHNRGIVHRYTAALSLLHLLPNALKECCLLLVAPSDSILAALL